MDPALVDLEQATRHAGDAFGEVEDPVVEFGGGEAAVGVAHPHRLGGIDRITGEDHLHCVAQTDQPRVHREVGRAGEAEHRMRDRGVLGEVDEVAGRRQLAATGHCIAVDLRDDGLGQIPDPEPALRDMVGPGGRAVGRVVRAICAEVGGEVVA